MAGWRPMREADLPAVTAISAAVHGDYSESLTVYGERLALYPQGCFVWAHDTRITGLLVTHPWRGATPPALGAMLGALPQSPDRYYLHDIALLPDTRGSGAGRAAIALVDAAARAEGLDLVTLVAVNGADRYWAANGFSYDAGDGGYGPGSFAMRRQLS